MVQIFSRCLREKRVTPAGRAGEPSGPMVSQRTPMARHPANRTKSAAGSGGPARCNAAPGGAGDGDACPGWTRSFGMAGGAAIGRMVWEREVALMEVVIPRAAAALI